MDSMCISMQCQNFHKQSLMGRQFPLILPYTLHSKLQIPQFVVSNMSSWHFLWLEQNPQFVVSNMSAWHFLWLKSKIQGPGHNHPPFLKSVKHCIGSGVQFPIIQWSPKSDIAEGGQQVEAWIHSCLYASLHSSRIGVNLAVDYNDKVIIEMKTTLSEMKTLYSVVNICFSTRLLCLILFWTTWTVSCALLQV